MIDRARSLHLFWRHVTRRAHHLMSAGQRVVCDFIRHQLRQAKVGNSYSSAGINEDVFRFDVSVDDSFVVSELECLADLRNDCQCLLRFEFTALQQLSQIRSVDILHQEVVERT